MTTADALIGAALAGREVSDADLARLASETDDALAWNLDRVETRVRARIAGWRTRRRHVALLGALIACLPLLFASRDPLHSPLALLSRRAGEEVAVRAPGLTLPSVDLTPVVVLIDDTAVREVGWPIPRRLYAELIDRLGAARVVAFDVPFEARDDAGTESMVDAIRRHERVVLGADVSPRREGREVEEWPREYAGRYGARAPKGAPRMAWADLPDSRLLAVAAGLGATGIPGRGLLNFPGRATPTLSLVARAMAGVETGIRPEVAGRATKPRDVEVLSVDEVFAPGARERLAGRVVYVGISAGAGRETVEVAGKREPRVVMLARR